MRLRCAIHKMGGAGGVYVQGPAQTLRIQTRVVKRKGLPEWRIFTNTGSTDAALCQGDARTGLGRDGAG